MEPDAKDLNALTVEDVEKSITSIKNIVNCSSIDGTTRTHVVGLCLEAIKKNVDKLINRDIAVFKYYHKNRIADTHVFDVIDDSGEIEIGVKCSDKNTLMSIYHDIGKNITILREFDEFGYMLYNRDIDVDVFNKPEDENPKIISINGRVYKKQIDVSTLPELLKTKTPIKEAPSVKPEKIGDHIVFETTESEPHVPFTDAQTRECEKMTDILKVKEEKNRKLTEKARIAEEINSELDLDVKNKISKVNENRSKKDEAKAHVVFDAYDLNGKRVGEPGNVFEHTAAKKTNKKTSKKDSK